MLKKLKVWEWLVGGTGVGVDSSNGAAKVTDDAWARFLQVCYVITLGFKTY